MKWTPTLQGKLKNAVALCTFLILLTLINLRSYAQLKNYATVTPSSGLVGYYTFLGAPIVNTNPGPDAGVVVGAENAGTSSNATFAKLTARYNNILGLANGEGEAWLQLKYTEPVNAGKTTFIRFDQPTGSGLSLDLINIIGDLTGLLKSDLVTFSAYSGATAAANGTLINNASVTSTVVKDALGVTYFAVTSSESYNSIRIRLRFRGNLLGLALGAAVSMNVYNGFNVDPQTCAPAIFTNIGDSNGLNVSLTSLLNNPERAIDGNINTAATLQAGLAGLGSEVSQTIFLNGAQGTDEYARVVLSLPASILNLDLFNTITLQAYNGNTPVGTARSVRSLLSLDLLGLLSNTQRVPVIFQPGNSFDRVKITLNNLLAVGGNILSGGINIHEVQKTVGKPTFAGLTGGTASVCGNQVSLSVDNPNAGYTYNWYRSGPGAGARVLLAGAAGSTFSDAGLAPGTYTYYLSAQQSGCTGESELETAAITVTAIPAAPSIAAVSPVCAGGTATLSVVNPLPGTTYSWYTLPEGGTPFSTGLTYTTDPLTANTTLYLEAANGSCISPVRTQIVITVNQLPALPEIITNNETVSSGQAATLRAATVAGNTIRWYAGPTGGAALATGETFVTPVLTADATYYVGTENAAGCQSATRVQVNVDVINNPANAGCNAALNQQSGITGICVGCSIQNPGNSTDANPANFTRINLVVGVRATGYQRLIFASPGVATDSIRLDLETPTGLADLNVLGGITVRILNGNNEVGSYALNNALLSLRLLSGNRFSATLPAGGIYDRVEIRVGALVAALSNLNIYGAEVVYPNPTVAATGLSVCYGTPTTLTAAPNGGTTLKWYADPTGGTALATGNTFTTPALTASTTYYIEVSKGTCANRERVPVMVTVNPAIVFAGGALTNATLAAAYTKQITAATGGTPAISYALAGGSTLPAGLTLSASGLIGGTPTAAGNFTFAVVATDSKNCTATASFTLTVTPAMALPAASLPNGTTGSIYPVQILPAATGGTTPYTYSATNLPPGLSFNEVTRAISGTPSQAGTFTISLTATDANNNTVTRAYSLIVRDPLALPVATLADGTAGSPYTVQTIPAATGGIGPYTYSATGVPTGLTFDNATRQITGTPATAGTYTIAVTVVDGDAKTVTRNYTLKVNNPLSLAAKILADGTVNAVYATETIPVATGGTTPYTYNAINLPPGLLFNASTRQIAGTPTQSGSFNVTVTVTDDELRTASQLYAIKVNGVLSLPSATLPNGLVGTAYAMQTLPAVTGGTAPYTYVATGVPSGLAFNPANRQLTGTPAIGGTFTIKVTATDNAGLSTSTDYALAVNVGAPSVAPVTICSGTQAVLTVSNTLPGVTYNWYAGTGNTVVFTGPSYTTPVLTTNTTYYAAAVSGTAVSSRTPVTVSINPAPSAATIVTNNEIISSGQRATLQATAEAGTTIKWYSAPTGGTLLETGPAFTTPVLTANATYYVGTENTAGCASTSRVAVTVTVTSGPVNPNCNAAVAQQTGIEGLCLLCSVQGAANSTDANLTNFTRINLVVGVGARGYQRLIFANPGTGTDSIRLDLETPVGLADLSVLGGITVKVLNNNAEVASYALTNALLDLKLLGGNRFTVTLPATGIYDRVEVSFGATVAALSNLMIYGAEVIYPKPAVAATGQTICAGNPTTLTATANGGTTLKWYNSPTSTTALATGNTFTTGPLSTTTIYYIGVSKGTCENTERIPVTVTVTSTPATPVVATVPPVCAGSTVAIAVNNPDPAVTYNWYTDPIAGSPVFSGPVFTTPALTTGTTYYVAAANGSCVGTTRTAVPVTVNPVPVLPQLQASATSVNMGQTAILTASSSDANVNFNWYTTPTSGTPVYTGAVYVTPPLMATTTYYLESAFATTGCASPGRVQVTITVNGGVGATVPCEAPVAQTNGVTGVALLAGVFNPQLAIDNDTRTGSSLVMPVGLLGASVYQRVNFQNLSNIGDTVKVLLTAPGKLLSVGLLSSIQVGTYNNASSNNDGLALNNPLINIELLSGSSEAMVTFVPAQQFNSIEVRLNSGLAGALASVDFNYAQRVPVAPEVVSANVTTCQNQTAVLKVLNPKTGVTYKWYNAGGVYQAGNDGVEFTTPVITANTSFFVAATTLSGCVSARTAVNVSVTPAPQTPVLISPTITTCIGNNVVIAVSNPVAGITYKWYNSANVFQADGTSFTVNNIAGPATYSVEAVSTCGTSARATANILIGTLDAPVVSPVALTVTAGSPAVLTASSGTAGVTFRWYDSPVSPTVLFVGARYVTDPLINAGATPVTKTYYVTAEVDGSLCGASARTAVVVTILPSGTPSDVPCQAATQQVKEGVDGIVLITGVFNPQLAVDNNVSSAASLVMPVGALGASVYQQVRFTGGLSTVGDTLRVRISSPGKLLSLAVLPSIELTTFQGLTSNNDAVMASNPLIQLELLSDNSAATLTIIPQRPFDGVELRLRSGLAAVLTSLDFNYAQRTQIAPEVTAAAVATCAGSSVTLSVKNPVASGTVYRWYRGTAYLNQDGATLTTDPSLAPGTYDYFVSALRNGCESAKTKVVVTITAGPGAPVAAVGNPATTCPNTPVVLAVNAVANVSFNWYDALTGGNLLAANTNSYTTSANLAAGVYDFYVAAVNASACTSASARTKITLTVNPTAVAADIIVNGANTPLCLGATATLNASSTTITSPVFRWYSDAALTSLVFTGANYVIPALTGNITLYVTASGTNKCANQPADAKVVSLVVNPPATATDLSLTGADAPLCAGASATLIASTTTVVNPVFTWYNDAALSSVAFIGAVYQVSNLTATKTFYVTVKGANRCENTPGNIKQITVTVNPGAVAADVNVTGAGGPFCTGSSVQLTATSASVTNPIFTWYSNPALTNAVFTGAVFNTPVLTGPTTYYVTVRGTDRCENTAANARVVTLSVNPPALASDISVTGAGAAICAGTFASLEASSTTVTNPVFTWYSDAMLANAVFTGPVFNTPSITATTTYYVTVRGTNKCENTAATARAVTLTVNPPAVSSDIIISGAGPVCAGRTAVLTASSTTVTNAVFTWYTDAALTNAIYSGTVFTTPALTANTTYYVTVRGTNKCENTAATARTVAIVVNPLPDMPVVAAAGTTVCSGDGTVLSIQNAQTGVQYQWFDVPAGGTPVHIGNQFTISALNNNATYYVLAVSTAGCGNATGRVTVAVNVTPKPVAPAVVSTALSVCAGSTAVLRVSNPQTGITYRWYTSATNGTELGSGPEYTTAAITAVTTFYVSASTATCTSASRTAVVVTPAALPVPPAAVSAASNALCSGSSTTLSVNNPVAGLTYRWYTSATGGTSLAEGSSFTTPAVTTTTTYYVEAVTTATSCASASRTAIEVTVLSKLDAPVVSAQAITGTSITFQWNAVPGAAGYEVSLDNGLTWLPPSTGANGTTYLALGLQPDQNVSIRVRAVGQLPCQLSDATTFTAKSDNPLGNTIFVPNTFTPNNDGKNDVLYVYGNTIAKMKLRVYNQWGQFLYESLSIQNGWNGTYKGEIQPNGVYVYYLEAEFNDGTKATKKGTVTLLR